MKLYYSPGACSLADHIALVESGLPFTAESVNLKTKTTAGGEDYSQINPKGYVPALVLDGGEVLTENVAILSFIADKAGKLTPARGLAYWRVLETTAFISTELHKNFKPFFSPDATDSAKAQAEEILGKKFSYLSERLGERDFIVGDQLSIADCYLFVMLMWAKTKVGLTLPSSLNGYFERLKAMPSVARALSEEGLS